MVTGCCYWCCAIAAWPAKWMHTDCSQLMVIIKAKHFLLAANHSTLPRAPKTHRNIKGKLPRFVQTQLDA